MADWYLIHTKPRQERTAQLNLERQHYTVYLPMHAYRKRIEPLFARYLFIHLDSESDDWGPIRSTRGVANLVRFGGVPAKVPDDLIKFLQNEEDGHLEQKAERFCQGDSVEITEGVLAGYQGIFQAETSAERAAVLLNVSDRYTSVQVSIKSLEKQG